MDLLTDDELAQVLREWVQDLRTTEIKQLSAYLLKLRRGKPAEACCLGILCLQGERRGMLTRAKGAEYFADVASLPYITYEDVLPQKFAYRLFDRAEGEFAAHLCADVDEKMLTSRWRDEPRRSRWHSLKKYAHEHRDGKIIFSDLNDYATLPFADIADVVECSRHLNSRANPIYGQGA